MNITSVSVAGRGGAVRQHHHLDHADEDAAEHREWERHHPADERGGQAPEQQVGTERDLEMSLVRWFRIGAAMSALTAASVPARTHTCVDTAFTRTPDSDAPLGVVGRGPHREAEARALQQEREHTDDHGHGDEHHDLLAPDREVVRPCQMSVHGRRETRGSCR